MNIQNREITRQAVVAAIYVVVSLAMAPISLGPLNFRLSEGLNLLALYDKKYIRGVVVGVFITNLFAYGIYDMIIGTASTYIFLHLGVWVADRVSKQMNNKMDNFQLTILRYGILTIIFSLSMFTIAAMLVFIIDTGEAFWPLYVYLVVSEALAMILGGLIVYPVMKRIDLEN